MKREYDKESNKTLSDSSWYHRFIPELVEFLHQCVIHGIEELAKEPGRNLAKNSKTSRMLSFRTYNCSSSLPSLADKFPETRARTVAIGVKVGVETIDIIKV